MATCKLGQLPPKLQTIAGKGSASTAARELAQLGHPVGPTTVKDHRANRCACARPHSARIQKPAPHVLTLDIERLPGRARLQHRGLVIEGDFWDLNGWKSTIGYRIPPDAVLQWPRTICAAWRFYGSARTEFASEWDDGQAGMLQRIWDAYDRANVLYGHNVDRFDTKHLNTGWRDQGLPAPSLFKIVDTLTEARRTFGDESMQLVALTKRLGIDTKTDKYSVTVARAAVAGDKAAQRKLKAYNVGDVAASEALVDRLRGWIPSHPHDLAGMNPGVPTCNQCWGDNLAPNGERLAQVMAYPLFRCQDCGANVQGRSGRRVAEATGVR